MKKSELTSFVKEEIISALTYDEYKELFSKRGVEVKEQLGVSRKKLSDFYLSVGGRDFAAAIMDIADENVLDSLVAALNFREKDGTSYYGPMGEQEEKISDDDVKNQEEYNKELEKTVKLQKQLGEDEEPSDKEIKKNKGLAKMKEELALLQKEMKSLVRDYKKAEGEEKQNILKKLKDMTERKKELDKKLG